MRRLLPMIPLAVFLAAAGCNRDAAPATATTQAPASAAAKPADAALTDEFSYAQPQQVRITDLALELAVDFAAKQLAGNATYALDWKDQAATELVLDTRDLTIDKVEALRPAQGDRAEEWAPLQFALAPADKVLGSKLTIQAPQRPAKVRVTYKTSPQASGSSPSCSASRSRSTRVRGCRCRTRRRCASPTQRTSLRPRRRWC